MSTSTMQDDKKIQAFASEYYDSQKQEFVKNFTEKLKSSIYIGEQEIATGNYMTLEEFKKKFNKEHLQK